MRAVHVGRCVHAAYDCLWGAGFRLRRERAGPEGPALQPQTRGRDGAHRRDSRLLSCSTARCRSPARRAPDARRFRRADSSLRKHPRNLHPADLLPGPAGAGVPQPGLWSDVHVRQTWRRADRFGKRSGGIRTAPSAIGEKRGPGDRPVCDGSNDGTAGAAGLRRNPEGVVHRRHACQRKGARLHPGHGEAVRRGVQIPPPYGAQDAAYAQAMKRVAQRYPDDLDAATLYAEAAFLMLTRAGALDIRDSNVLEVLSVLERALARGHPPSGRVPSLRPHDRADDGAGAGETPAPPISGARCPEPVISITCLRTPGARSAAGATPCRPACRHGSRIRSRRRAKAS